MKKRVRGRSKLKSWKLREEEVRREFTAKLEFQEIGHSWQETQEAILDDCMVTCGET